VVYLDIRQLFAHDTRCAGNLKNFSQFHVDYSSPDVTLLHFFLTDLWYM